MSHLKERKDKSCLNCNAQVNGRFCHICGQENLEPAESVWHLVTHFFNDITHFDGKFFSTLKLLIFKPGFLSAEYKRGRRASYLNPVRMYIFTSFLFFFIFFYLFSVNNQAFIFDPTSGYTQQQLDRMDSTEFSNFTKMVSDDNRSMSRDEYKKFADSNDNVANFTIVGKYYESRAEYDSLKKTGIIKENWFEKILAEKNFQFREKYKSRKELINSFWTKFSHYFPQILFISLPFFALFLKLIYIRRKSFYFVSHGIYSIHLYIFYFIFLLLTIGMNRLEIEFDFKIFAIFDLLLLLWILIYEYKAMRSFYAQGRMKTILKFCLALFGRFIIILILFIVFFFLSVFNI